MKLNFKCRELTLFAILAYVVVVINAQNSDDLHLASIIEQHLTDLAIDKISFENNQGIENLRGLIQSLDDLTNQYLIKIESLQIRRETFGKFTDILLQSIRKCKFEKLYEVFDYRKLTYEKPLKFWLDKIEAYYWDKKLKMAEKQENISDEEILNPEQNDELFKIFAENSQKTTPSYEVHKQAGNPISFIDLFSGRKKDSEIFVDGICGGFEEPAYITERGTFYIDFQIVSLVLKEQLWPKYLIDASSLGPIVRLMTLCQNLKRQLLSEDELCRFQRHYSKLNTISREEIALDGKEKSRSCMKKKCSQLDKVISLIGFSVINETIGKKWDSYKFEIAERFLSECLEFYNREIAREFAKYPQLKHQKVTGNAEFWFRLIARRFVGVPRVDMFKLLKNHRKSPKKEKFSITESTSDQQHSDSDIDENGNVVLNKWMAIGDVQLTRRIYQPAFMCAVKGIELKDILDERTNPHIKEELDTIRAQQTTRSNNKFLNFIRDKLVKNLCNVVLNTNFNFIHRAMHKLLLSEGVEAQTELVDNLYIHISDPIYMNEISAPKFYLLKIFCETAKEP